MYQVYLLIVTPGIHCRRQTKMCCPQRWCVRSRKHDQSWVRSTKATLGWFEGRSRDPKQEQLCTSDGVVSGQALQMHAGNHSYPVWSDATVELLKLKMLKLPVDAGCGRDVSAYKAYRSLLLMLLLTCRTIWVPVQTRSSLPKVLVVVMWAPKLHQVAMGVSAWCDSALFYIMSMAACASVSLGTR